MNVKPGGKYKGTRTLKRGSIYRIRNKSYARTLQGGGWGKKKSPEEDNQAKKKDKADAQKIAKAEQKRIKDDAEAAKKEKGRSREKSRKKQIES